MSEQFPDDNWEAPDTDTHDSESPEEGSLNGADVLVRDTELGEAPQENAADHAGSAAAPVTGLDSVDRVLAKEAAVSGLPVNERAAAYQELHAELEAILNQQPGSLPTGLTGQ